MVLAPMLGLNLPALAQDEHTAEQPRVTVDIKTVAPVALNTFTPYPRNATGASTVLLELLVTARGQVAETRILQGTPPFSQAALQAVPRWRFTPAKKGGQPTAARIRFRIDFSQPDIPAEENQNAEAADPAGIDPEPIPAATATRTTDDEIQVMVQGYTVPGARSLGAPEVRRLPGAFGDPFRAISVLPGVAPLVTGLPVSYVRGAPPGNVGFGVDGIRLPLLFHAFLGPSVVHPRLLNGVKMYAGGYPASVGRYAGAVIDASLTTAAQQPVAEVSLRLVDAGAYVETPFDEGRGRLVLAGRYSYTALLLSLLSDLELRYWDYQALVSYELSSRDTVRVFALGALDFAGQTPEDSETTSTGRGNEVAFHRMDLRYERLWGEATSTSLALTLGRDSTQGESGAIADRVSGLRAKLRSQLLERVLLRAGTSAIQDKYDLELDSDSAGLLDVLTLFPSRTDSVWGAYADVVVSLAPGLQWTPGLRVDRYRSGAQKNWAVSPRMALATKLSEAFSVEHAVGVAHQPPNYVPGIPGVAVAGLPGGLQRSLQSSATLLGRWSEYWRGDVGVFYNATFGLTDPFSLNQDLALDSQEAAIRSLGRSFGLELSLQRRFFGGFGGMLSYTLSRSLRSHGETSTLSGYDRPHVLNMALSQSLGAGWLASGRGLFYSGIPGGRRGEGNAKLFDQSRARPFFRVDLRLEKRIAVGAEGSWTIVAELLNASLSREVLRRSCEPQCRDEVVGPIFLPSLGLIGRF